jgi:5-formyltetrahydrofolate cyclo-ligase
LSQLLSNSEGTTLIENESSIVKNKLFSHPWFNEARRIAIYVSTNGEIITDAIIYRALEDGKEVFIPRIMKGHDQMEMLKLSSSIEFDNLDRTTWGIRQHSVDTQPLSYLDEIAPEHDLIVMPGVAFTLDGKRLGHGRGYYDRFLHDYANKNSGHFPKTIALALNFQILKDLPMSDRDVHIDQVLYAS